MNKFELVVKDGTFNERMGVGFYQPAEQVVHQFRNPVGRGSHMDDLFPGHDSDTAAPV
jgi:hypothetical protein